MTSSAFMCLAMSFLVFSCAINSWGLARSIPYCYLKLMMFQPTFYARKTHNMGVLDWRRARSKDDLAGASFPRHAHNLPARGAADDGVINQAHNAAVELGLHST